MRETFTRIGAAFAMVGVALGAFGTHALRGRVSDRNLEIWSTGVHYQLAHALAILLVASMATGSGSARLLNAAKLFAAGIFIFSGSLYALVLTDVRVLGAITPLGGVCFLAGWGVIAFGLHKGDLSSA